VQGCDGIPAATVAPVSGFGSRVVLVTVATLMVAAACSSVGSHTPATTTSTTAAVTTSTSSTSGGSPAGSTADLPLPPVAPVSWKTCNGTNGPIDDQCATLMVPRNYAQPDGTKIGIALARKPATGHKIGSLVMNPGGPGASGIDELDYLASLLPSSVTSRFDIVSFDPRGVARSDPVRCETGPELDQFIHLNPAPTTQAGFNQLLAASQLFAQRCEAMSGPLLPFVGTVNVARDMDEIRAAVGDAKLTYFGFSYGTFLGATYADLFPTHIRAMVLDGALNPDADPISSDITQAAGFDQELTSFFAYCTGNSLCPWKPAGDNLRADYDALMARIAAHPLPGSGSRALGAGEAFFGVAQELYDTETWPDLATGLASADNGDGSLLLEFSDEYTGRNTNGAYTNALEADNAITCVDAPWPRDPAVLQQAAVTAQKEAPDFGVADLYGALACTAWPVPPTSTPHVITAAASPPIVVVGSTGDPATPYSDSEALAGQLQHGVLLTRVGDGHTGYRSSQCVRNYVNSYLVDLTVPPSGIRCPSP
jgi:pimeloyl-ACP methyl ester carboxylesterase/uncharacterized protein YceK